MHPRSFSPIFPSFLRLHFRPRPTKFSRKIFGCCCLLAPGGRRNERTREASEKIHHCWSENTHGVNELLLLLCGAHLQAAQQQGAHVCRHRRNERRYSTVGKGLDSRRRPPSLAAGALPCSIIKSSWSKTRTAHDTPPPPAAAPPISNQPSPFLAHSIIMANHGVPVDLLGVHIISTY